MAENEESRNPDATLSGNPFAIFLTAHFITGFPPFSCQMQPIVRAKGLRSRIGHERKNHQRRRGPGTTCAIVGGTITGSGAGGGPLTAGTRIVLFSGGTVGWGGAAGSWMRCPHVGQLVFWPAHSQVDSRTYWHRGHWQRMGGRLGAVTRGAAKAGIWNAWPQPVQPVPKPATESGSSKARPQRGQARQGQERGWRVSGEGVFRIREAEVGAARVRIEFARERSRLLRRGFKTPPPTPPRHGEGRGWGRGFETAS